ncbi:MAG TPA: TIGR03960 family B12-binding radical SAM protein [Candidatus Acidoferrum sp.]|nr:TIGR03960 family B12-binding radical SAM protein [Candidatus Acidoferrum sp.]
MRHVYADFIDRVAVPARYLGGEYQSVVKDPATVAARVALAFPDLYDIGMSHMGTKILYSVLNADPRIACERCFCPWVDMEAELRARDLPLCSLESQTPLAEFDVIGVSLQYELTFTNVLTLLDLGRVPLRAAARADRDPLVLGGGPTATHPEPVAPFFDAFFIGEAEEELGGLVVEWAEARRAGRPRLDALAELAARYPIYVPALYRTEVDEATGLEVVGRPLDGRVPERVRRGFVADIDRYPFPSDTPVPYAEAVFDRAGVEIARGCTEGCRFCQAGMIYRPVRERSPASIVKSVLDGVDRAGYDETSLTSLSTADYSCITPLVAEVAGRLREKKVSLSVSSLRAYGLGEEILDHMAQMRITGLTFAPEAGTQRMRDVVNKNITEAHVAESAERVFGRGWNRLKLYFMIGLPGEDDDDVAGIVETGQRMLRIGRKHVGKRAEVTVSVSSHVPKPHTPFQWCAQDSTADIERKQAILRGSVSERGLRLKVHDCGVSTVEGVLSRGDRRLADAIETVWRRGARFDGWDELFDLDRWLGAFRDSGVDVAAYLGTRPVSARLPWDHIDVGLEDGFLLAEYRKALADKLSPPCGKVVGQLVHASNLAEALAQKRKLVCYDCGVACDLVRMREQRIDFLRSLGAEQPVVRGEPVRRRDAAGMGQGRGRPRPQVSFAERPVRRFRLRYTKLGRSAFLGHLDTARVLARMFRRGGVEVAYTRGFHPKPSFVFAPALSLGVASLGELVDVAVEAWPEGAAELAVRLAEVSPEGIEWSGAWELDQTSPSLARLVRAYDLLVRPASPLGAAVLAARADAFLAAASSMVARGERAVDVRARVEEVEVLGGAAAARLLAALDWPAAPALLRARVGVTPDGSAKPIEVARALGIAGGDGPAAPRCSLARLGFVGTAERPELDREDEKSANVNRQPPGVSAPT